MKYMHRKGIKTSLGDRKIGLMPYTFCVHARLVYIYNTSHKTAAQTKVSLTYHIVRELYFLAVIFAAIIV